MSRSLERGDYRLIMAIESASQASQWYRICADTRTGSLSCDCVAWIKQRAAPADRSCKHTRLAAQLMDHPAAPTQMLRQSPTAAAHPLIQATQQQWPGLIGSWGIEERDARIGTERYRFVLIQLATPTGYAASGVVAFAQRHTAPQADMQAAVAGWAGYAIAGEIARQAGFPLVGQPPQHFRVPERQRRADTTASQIGIRDILRVGNTVDLGDGLRPHERAEQTLRLFLGDLYLQLEQQGYLDVSSQLDPRQQRVYRLRRDPGKRVERRIRVFERGRYVRDYCVVRAAHVPEADHFLTVFLRLLSDEQGILSVVKGYNIFPPYSDSKTRETTPAVWRAAGCEQHDPRVHESSTPPDGTTSEQDVQGSGPMHPVGRLLSRTMRLFHLTS
ncbi:MAG TPA: hypothetical protein VFZ66_17930 [Herpetosiphonaceae bacterium]